MYTNEPKRFEKRGKMMKKVKIEEMLEKLYKIYIKRTNIYTINTPIYICTVVDNTGTKVAQAICNSFIEAYNFGKGVK